MPIPFISTPDKAISDTTQDLIPVADIVDDIVIYRHGGAALIMESTSLNFGLLSEREQQAVIASYAGILNSFNFPVQIVVRTQKKDISSYINFLNIAETKVKNPKSSKNGNKDEEEPKADFCSFKTKDEKIVKDLAFDVNKDYKRVFIKHTFEINDLEIPKEYLNDFVKARLYAIRKGKLIRQVNIDGEQVKKEYDLEV